MKKVYTFLIALVIGAFSLSALGALSVAGDWTINGSDNKPKSVVALTETNGVVSGKIIKVYNKEGKEAVCSKCSGEWKDKPLTGLPLVWDLKKKSDTEWVDGKILAPKKGKIYPCSATLSSDGKTLKVKISSGLLGKTQTWVKN